MNTRKIHFINRADPTNVGDWATSPLNYYYDFFRRYNLMRHDIEHVKWIEISRHDIVILGGGGMIDVGPEFNENINRLLDACPNVIAWGIGFNRHYDGRPFDVKIKFDRFRLLSIRDYGHPSGFDYVPCVSCKAAELGKRLPIERDIGVVAHKDFAPGEFPYDTVFNFDNFQNVTDFISSSGAIVTSSYHAVYWATLMGRKVVCANPFSTKFEHFKYKPAFYSGNLEKDIESAKIYEGVLAENIALNDAFFEKVKGVVESVITRPDNTYQPVAEMFYGVDNDRRLNDFMKHVCPKMINEAVENARREMAGRLDAAVAEIEEKLSRRSKFTEFRYKLMSKISWGKMREHYKRKLKSQ